MVSWLWLSLHQGVLFIHVIAFAVTLSAVLHEDVRWLLGRRIDTTRLRATMRMVSIGLVVLWVSGLALWAFAAAASPLPWTANAKLCAKLVVVSLLTLNGWALHKWVFATLPSAAHTVRFSGPLPAVLGAFSSASWVYAAFVGVARPLSGVLSFADFMALYAAGVSLAVVLGLAAMRARGWPLRWRPLRRVPHHDHAPLATGLASNRSMASPAATMPKVAVTMTVEP